MVATPVRRASVLQEVPVTGTVVSPSESRLSAEVEGRVTEVLVEIGDPVEQGAPLARLDPELARIELRRASAASREAREALGDARRRLAEAERLAAGNAFAESALLSLRSEVQVAEATLARLGAQEARARALLERHTVHAPFTGAITHKLASAGEWVSPGTPLLELVATEALRIDFQVPQEFYPRVRADARVAVVLDAAPDREWVGRVRSAVPRSDASARTFLLLVVLDDASAPMIPGMSASAKLRLDSGREGVVVPQGALRRQPDGRASVFVVAPESAGTGDADTVAERRVVLGPNTEGGVEIREGLDDGAWVVVAGHEGLLDGQRVRVRRRELPDV